MKVFLMLLFLISPLYADDHHHEHDHHEEHKHSKKSLKAHVHGEAKLTMAVDGKILAIELHGASESFLGFEHKPKSKKEKMLWDQTQKLWEKDLNRLITLPSHLMCQTQESKIKMEFEDGGKGHSEIEAQATIKCQKDLKDFSAEINLRRHFPKMKEIDAEILPHGKAPYKRELKKNKEILKF